MSGILLKKYEEELKQLRAQNKALTEALEAVEWDEFGQCTWCRVWKPADHHTRCKVYNALKMVRGE